MHTQNDGNKIKLCDQMWHSKMNVQVMTASRLLAFCSVTTADDTVATAKNVIFGMF